MTKEELKAHCEKQVKMCEEWAKGNGREPSGKIYEEHKLILDLIKALEQQSNDCKIFGHKENCFGGATEYECNHCDYKMQTVEQKPSDDCVSLEVYKQVIHERDIAIEQLKELGYELGEKIETSNDCVSRKAVDLLCFKYLKPNNDDNIAFYEHFCDLPPVTPTQRWIPVSEKLPEVGEKVLCQCQANIYDVLKLTADGWYYDNRHCYMSGFVIAWQPLPKPYEEKRGNEDG